MFFFHLMMQTGELQCEILGNRGDFLRKEVNAAADGRLFTPEMLSQMKPTQKEMLQRLLMMSAPMVMAWYYYGGRAVWLMLLSVLTAVFCEYSGQKLVGTVPMLRDFSAVVTGLTVALLLPASAPVWLFLLATAFAIWVVKVPFGTARSLLFSPAAAGVAFVTVCLPDYVFGYSVVPQSGAAMAVYGTESYSAGVSLTQMLTNHTSMGLSPAAYLDVLLGNVAGAMGTGCVIALLGGLLFLAVRDRRGFTAAVSCLAGAAVYAFCFPRILTGRWQSVFMELSGGMLFFAALFLLPESAILPKRFWGRVAYGAAAGLITMLFRRFGVFEEGAVFAVLLVNALTAAFDKLPETHYLRRMKRRYYSRKKKAAGANREQPAQLQGGEADV